jgi:hypothetical protein
VRVLRNAKVVGFELGGGGQITAARLAPTVAPDAAELGAATLATPSTIPCADVVSTMDIPGFQKLMLAGSIVHVESFVNERTFDKQTVGHQAYPPPLETGVANLTLCGSWPRVDSAVHDMEKAVVTGMMAANRLLAARGLPSATIIPLRRLPLPRAAVSLVGRLLPRPPGVPARAV